MDPIKSALNLFRRLPPEDVESTFHAVTVLREALTDELLQHIDFPLKVGYDKDANKSFIISDFNCNGDSYRSSSIFVPSPVDRPGQINTFLLPIMVFSLIVNFVT